MGKIYFDPKPGPATRMEASSRFICGASFGLVLGLVVALYMVSSNVWLFSAVVVGTAVIFGVLALYFGDDFWDLLRSALNALPWF